MIISWLFWVHGLAAMTFSTLAEVEKTIKPKLVKDLMLMIHNHRNDPSTIGFNLFIYENLHQKDLSVPFPIVFNHAQANLLADKIQKDPLNYDVKQLHRKRRKLLRSYISTESIVKIDKDFHQLIFSAVRDKIVPYLNAFKLGLDPKSTGPSFMDWTHRNGINPQVFRSEICDILKEIMVEKWTIKAEVAAQIWSYFIHKKDQWNEFQSRKIAELKANHLPDFSLSPVPLFIHDQMYLLKDYISKGSFGIVFEGYKQSHPDELLIFKLLLPRKNHGSTENEILALKALDRFVDFDKANAVIVQKKVPGVTLQSLIPQLINEPNELKRIMLKYEKLDEDFYKKTNIIHNDIAPRNVIVNLESGEFSVIDFGLSTAASKDPAKLVAQLKFSKQLSSSELNLEILDRVLKEEIKKETQDSERMLAILSEIIINMRGRDARKYIAMKHNLERKMDKKRRLELEEELRRTVFKNGENFKILSVTTDAYADQLDQMPENRLHDLEQMITRV